MQRTHLPAWCETRGEPGIDGRYTVACYYTSTGHPVSREHAERVELIEFAPDGTRLRVDVGTIERSPFATSRGSSVAVVSTLPATLPYTVRSATATATATTSTIAAHPRQATLRRRQNG